MEIEVTNITAADNEVATGINATVTFIDYENNSGEIVVYVKLPLEKQLSISDVEEKAQELAKNKLKELVVGF
ncbi:hypothetical protein ACOMFI_24265 [Enterobacter cloacae complex sp. YD70/O97D2]|uniref:hypothetical protein n=1 Tax=Enterobacter hormaechei TaxID=158836 RepID=UPI0007DC234C|nr:hypothetical protein [Enterobacter hormaechei]MBK4666265.1 hypothetical protein [Enterobacter hormaechei]OAR82026.1 hypothetical protein AYO00_14600 [Enterobacter hormaechei]RAZ53228.1 hypothetical protein DP194_23415 [Enterobacter hormaechei subsp. xiangfangensis]WMA77675.1 hypothetical protein QPR74_10415 [Enterobacter hormaechei]WMA82381.1 hypothetical protein QPR70_10430 [Enterobacter hormaechei]